MKIKDEWLIWILGGMMATGAFAFAQHGIAVEQGFKNEDEKLAEYVATVNQINLKIDALQSQISNLQAAVKGLEVLTRNLQ